MLTATFWTIISRCCPICTRRKDSSGSSTPSAFECTLSLQSRTRKEASSGLRLTSRASLPPSSTDVTSISNKTTEVPSEASRKYYKKKRRNLRVSSMKPNSTLDPPTSSTVNSLILTRYSPPCLIQLKQMTHNLRTREEIGACTTTKPFVSSRWVISNKQSRLAEST